MCRVFLSCDHATAIFVVCRVVCSHSNESYDSPFTCSSEKREMMVALAASQAVVKTVFCIEENREEGAEKTPSTCSNDQGNQHFSHLVYCDTRINKI